MRWLIVAALLACNTAPPGVSPPSPRPSEGAAEGNPLVAHALPPERQTWLEGAVDESIAAGSYVYLKLRVNAGPPVWVVSLGITTPAAHHVRVLVLGRAEHFTSRRLARDFSPLLFGAVRAADSRPIQSKGTST
jgi:hypothetical protein